MKILNDMEDSCDKEKINGVIESKKRFLNEQKNNNILSVEQIKQELKKVFDLEPIEQEEFLKDLAKKSGRKLSRLKEQLAFFKKRKREGEELTKKNFPVQNLSTKLGNMFDKKELAEKIIEVQPCFYDKARNWWLWNWPETKWVRVDETDILNAIDKQATINTINSKEKNEMIEALKQVSRLNAPVPIKSTWIQFNNIIVDIENGNKFRAKPDYFVTNPIPWELDEEGFFETPIMDKIFEEWVGKENIQTLYEILAYCLIPNYPIHRIFCFIGGGMNGKSCFLNLLRKFIGGDNCCSTELDTLLQSRFEVTRLHKKLVCQMGETNFSEMNKTSVLKKLSGGDLIGFEYKNKDPFEEINYAKIIIATNNLPATNDKTIGFYRRWMIIDFPNQFSEKKDILAEIPEEEYSSLAVKCSFILKDLLKNRSFTNEGSVEDRMKKYEDHSNPLEKFLREYTTEDYCGTIWKHDFSKKLNSWCKQNRFREISDVAIGKKMKELGITQSLKVASWDINKKARVWIGLKWREEMDN
jgi:P4 family phage/plasmid primase-like protien